MNLPSLTTTIKCYILEKNMILRGDYLVTTWWLLGDHLVTAVHHLRCITCGASPAVHNLQSICQRGKSFKREGELFHFYFRFHSYLCI